MGFLSNNRSIVIAISALAGVFILDLVVPLGVAVGVLYVLVLTTLGTAKLRYIYCLAGASIVLTVMVYFVTLTEGMSWMAAVNRGISVLAIALAAGIVSQRSQAEMKLKAKFNRVTEKNDELANFTYIASHDLQEPLRAIRNFSGLLNSRYGDKLDERGVEILEFIDGGARRMSELVVALLDYSRLGKNSPIVSVDLGQIVDTVMVDLSATITEHGAEMTVSSLPVIMGKETELRLLFQNLVSNAVKFVAPDVTPRVRIECVAVKDGWEFSVTDNGIGIAEAHIGKVFDLFSRLHTQDTYKGTGIGLAHCKRIVEMHGGSLSVRSTPNIGSTFSFSLMETNA